MDEARITMQGKWWSDKDPQKQAFTLKFSEEIHARFSYRTEPHNEKVEEVILDLKEMKIRRKTEEVQVTSIHGDSFHE